MIKVSTMLYVEKDGKPSEETTRYFLENYEVRDILTKCVEDDLKHLEIDGFSVDLLIYEVESEFVKFLFAKGLCEGLIYCGCISHPDVMHMDLQYILGQDAEIHYNETFTGDSVTEDVYEHPENYNIISAEFTTTGACYAEVYNLADEEEDDDDYTLADSMTSTHIC